MIIESHFKLCRKPISLSEIQYYTCHEMTDFTTQILIESNTVQVLSQRFCENNAPFFQDYPAIMFHQAIWLPMRFLKISQFMNGVQYVIKSLLKRTYIILVLSILVAETGWTGVRIDFLMNSEFSHFMAHVANKYRGRQASYTIMLPKIILNSIQGGDTAIYPVLRSLSSVKVLTY